MAINPFPRISPLDIPTYLPSAARAPEGTFSNIAALGEGIAANRERNALGELLRGAVDPQTGALDMNKAATAIALSGRDPTKYLTLLEAEQRRKEAQSYRQEALDVARQGRDIQQKALDRPDVHYLPGSLMSPGGVVTVPRTGGEVGTPKFQPFPSSAPAPAPASVAPGPQSALDVPPPDLAAVEPPPEEAPPYAVAGPPMPPPQAPAAVAPAAPAVAPAAKPDRNEGFLQRLPANAQTIVKGVANYEIDPNSITGKDREEVIAAAKLYRPDYNMTEYQKVGSPPSAETQARLALSKSFIARIPTIKSRLEAGELTDPGGKALAIIGQGGPGELRRAIDEGAEGLERLLTGAAMPASEAANYARRYTFSALDTRETAIRKLNELENANRWMVTEVGHRRAGEDLLNGFRDKFGEAVVEKAPPARAKNDAEVNRLVSKAKAAVARDPKAYDETIKILQERLPQGVDARRLLGQ